MYSAIPLTIFVFLFLIWEQTSHIRLNKSELFYIKYFTCNILFVICFYCLCIFSSVKWVYDTNWQVALFILVTLLFYIFSYRDRE